MSVIPQLFVNMVWSLLCPTELKVRINKTLKVALKLLEGKF